MLMEKKETPHISCSFSASSSVH